MPKAITPSVLFQLGAVTQPLGPGANITNIQPLPAGASVYGDAFTNMPKPAIVATGAPQSILARTPSNEPIDWNRLILDAPTAEEGIAAIRRAGELRDARAVESIIMAQSDAAPWVPELEGTELDAVFWDVSDASIMSIGNEALPHLTSILGRVNEFDADESPCIKAVDHVRWLHEQGIDCSTAVPALLFYIEHGGFADTGYLEEAIQALRAIGGNGLRNRMLASLKKNSYAARFL